MAPANRSSKPVATNISVLTRKNAEMPRAEPMRDSEKLNIASPSKNSSLAYKKAEVVEELECLGAKEESKGAFMEASVKSAPMK